MIPSRDFFSQLHKLMHNLNLKPLLQIGQKVAAEVEVCLGFRKSNHPPVLVYQMGKVGSTSVSKSLKAAGLINYVFDIHFLSKDLIKYRNFYVESGIVPVPYHLDLGLSLRKRIIRGGCNEFKIISMVRDPIARQISDIFENLELICMEAKMPSVLFDAVEIYNFIEKKFADDSFFDYVFNWFDNELKKVFGIDVFAHPFNRESGWSLYRNGNTEALIIRLDDLSRVGENVITNFLGYESKRKIPILKANVRSQTQQSDAYQFVKDRLRLNKFFCEKIYASRFVRHFYSDDQVKKMSRQWI